MDTSLLILRRITLTSFWFVLTVIILLAAGEARAQGAAGQRVCPSEANCIQSVAYSACMTRRSNVLAAYPNPDDYNSNPSLKTLLISWHASSCVVQPGSTHGVYLVRNAGNALQIPLTGGAFLDEYYRMNLPPCPSGQTWNESTNKCTCPWGQTPSVTGGCVQCSSRNSEQGFINSGDITRSWSSRCVAGCEFKRVTGQSWCTTATGVGAPVTSCSGRYEFSGNGCDDPPPVGEPDEPRNPQPKETCKQVGTQTMCVKPDGRLCASASTGRQICWQPGQVGQQTDGPIAQIRSPGTSTPDPPNKPGETFTQVGDTITTTTTNDNRTITTTITNFTTGSGSDAGDSNNGQDTGGEGDASDGNDENGEGGTASGDCATPPTCTLGESIGCAILRQQWTNHCSALAGAGDTSLGDFSSLSDALPGLATATSDAWEDGSTSPGGNGPPTLDDINRSGWAARGNCPIVISFTVVGRSYTLDGAWICHLLDALAWLIGLVGIIHSGMILLSGFRKGG